MIYSVGDTLIQKKAPNFVGAVEVFLRGMGIEI